MNLNKFYQHLYTLTWLIVNYFFPDSTPTFIICNSLHYAIIKNTLRHLPKYRIIPATFEAKQFLIDNKIKYTTGFVFPRFIIEADFLKDNKLYLKKYTSLTKAILSTKSIFRIQMYHGVLDKHWTYSKLNTKYDLLLVPGIYAKKRLQDNAIKEKRIVIVGYPKLDTFFISKNKKTGKKRKKTILYAPTFGAISSLPFMIKSLVKLNERYQIIVKPHYYSEWYYIKTLRLYGVRVETDPDIVSLFRKSDVLISDSSSVAFEYLVTDKPIIVLNFCSWMYGDNALNAKQGPEIVFRNIFNQVSDIENLETQVQKLLKRYKPSQRRQEVKRNLFSHIGRSGERAAAEITKFIENH